MLICAAFWCGRSRKAKVAVVTFWLLAECMSAHAEVASIYGDGDGLCGHLTASGERFDCSAMTAAHRSLPFGTLVSVCHDGCVTVRINDRGPFVRGRHIDLSPRRGAGDRPPPNWPCANVSVTRKSLCRAAPRTTAGLQAALTTDVSTSVFLGC